MTALTLTPDELLELTGYRRPSAQLSELLRRGFHRARISRISGRVILERAHYDSVCAGQVAPHAPRLRPSLRVVSP